MTLRSDFEGVSIPGRQFAVAGLVALFVAACGGGGPGAPGSGSPAAADTTAPTVQSSVPGASASAVASTALVNVTFSEAMDVATLNAATFTLSTAGAAVAGNVAASGSAATFTPAAALASGTTYTATVSTGAKDLAGNPLAAAHSWTFTTSAAVAARAWSTPVLLESADGEARIPAVAASADDTPTGAAEATAVWVQYDGTHYSVYANRYQAGAWQGALLVEGEDVDATGPRVAMGKLGRTVMTWGYGFNGVYTVWANVYDPIPPLAAKPLPFSSTYARQLSVGGNANSPQVAFNLAGYDAFSVWTQYEPNRQPAAYRPAQQPYLFVPCDTLVACAWVEGDMGWRSTTLLEITGPAGTGPQVAGLGGNGADAVAVWQKSQAGIWASTHTASAGWAAAVEVGSGAAPAGETLRIAGAGDGSAIALWTSASGMRPTVLASRLSGAVWSAPVVIDNPAGDSDEAQVVIDAAGNAMFAWLQGGLVYARRCAAGGLSSCGAAALIGDASGSAKSVRLAGAPNGDAVVAWREVGGATPRIRANHFAAASASWDAAAALIGDGTRFNEAPEVAMNRQGKATLVWSKDEGGKTNVYASRLE